jgi:hypothetical protein
MPATGSVYLSTVPYYTNDLETREILKTEIDFADEEGTILDILEMTGRYKSSKNKEFFNYTNTLSYEKAIVEAAGGGTITAAATGVITFTAGSTKPRVTEIMMTSTGALGLVQAVSGNAVTIYAIDEIVLAATDEVTFPSNAKAEGTGAEFMRIAGMTKRSNQLQFFNTKTGTSDLALGSRVEVNWDGKDYYFQKQQHDAFIKHRADVAYAFITGKKATAANAAGDDVFLTRGLNSYVVDYGGIDYTAANAAANAHNIDLVDFRVNSRALDQVRAPKEYWLWAGGDFNASVDDLFVEELSGGAINYNSFGKGDAKKKAIDLGVQSFTKYGRSYHKTQLPAFDHPNVTVDAGYPSFGYFIPTNKVKGTGGESLDRICGRYLDMPKSIDGRYREKELGGLAATPTDERDVLEYVYTSIEGLEIIGVEHFAKITLAA